ncbi:MAG: hypothetical protein K1X72_16580 [Pyrinomonadaceae bacterium]|nr:hypothetical protein [Pyrinomonadaceae bacterium]
MKNLLLKFIVVIICLPTNLLAQANILASLDFDIHQDGFAFKNYQNEGEDWKNDIGAEDLIRMFGIKAVCKSGTNAQNCVLKAAARKWIEHYLEAMDIGHCEGIAVASLRFKTELAFKKRILPKEFQSEASTAYQLKLQQNIRNYVAYYWITQTFDEVTIPTKKMAELGPVKMVEILIDSMNNRKDTYLLGIKKYENGRIFDGHAIAPIAIEDTGNQYKIHVYDNNFPGEIRYLYINKTGTQQWSYNATANPNAKPNYVGDISTKTLDMTATSWREGKCFSASFADEDEKGEGCGNETASLNKPIFRNASFAKNSQDPHGEDAEFFLTGEGDMLVIENGKRLGYDPSDDHFHEEIPDGNPNLLIGGFEEDLQHYTLPYEESEDPYTIVFSGRHLNKESNLNFVFSAPGFTVGFDGIKLDPGETLTAEISRDGEQIHFTASADSETPEVFFAFDSEDDAKASYITNIEGIELAAGKTLTYDFDFEHGKLFFSDDDGNEDDYDIELYRINADGTVQEYLQNDLNIGKSDKYEMDFGDWDGKGDMCFKDDEDGDGFDDEQCDEEPNEEPPGSK